MSDPSRGEFVNYDIIGDLHGHVRPLEKLLETLGYAERGGVWQHDRRKAIFVGDLIDRGPGQIETLEIVRTMVETGHARIVMGNHEFNAIGWMTRDPDHPTDYLRQREGDKGKQNRHQHHAFLKAVEEESDLHNDWIDWFKTLPLWIEEPRFRVVHACWSDAAALSLKEHLVDGAILKPEAYPLCFHECRALYDATEVLLKGIEIPLPEGESFKDSYGHERTEMRVRWWDPTISTYKNAFMGPKTAMISETELKDRDGLIHDPDRVTFVGHYWMDASQKPAPLADRVACVDYSVAKKGRLVAYRYCGEDKLTADNFVSVDA